jgi:hypothetical protein
MEKRRLSPFQKLLRIRPFPPIWGPFWALFGLPTSPHLGVHMGTMCCTPSAVSIGECIAYALPYPLQKGTHSWCHSVPEVLPGWVPHLGAQSAHFQILEHGELQGLDMAIWTLSGGPIWCTRWYPYVDTYVLTYVMSLRTTIGKYMYCIVSYTIQYTTHMVALNGVHLGPQMGVHMGSHMVISSS